MVINIELVNEKGTEELAARLANCLRPPLILTFSGVIGAGKTTLIRAMLSALGVQSAIKSPTFSLVESYSYDEMQIHHFDLYRIQDETELEYIGFRDYFTDSAICCIEWPEHASMSLKQVDVNFELFIKGSERLMKVETFSAAGETMLSCFVGIQ